MGLFKKWFGREREGGIEARRPEDDLDQILAAPARAARLRRCVGFLPDLSDDLAKLLVHDVARHFLAYVVDLPGSEKHHHARPFGLFDHSIEVAEFALREAQARYFVPTTEVYPDRQAHRLPRFRYAAFFFALLHDAGKIHQVVIHGPGLEMWNPYVEPLAGFYRRHGRERCILSWKAGRGLDAHVWHTAYLNGVLIQDSVGSYLGGAIISEILEQKTGAARELAALIADADHRSTREAIARQASEEENSKLTATAPGLFVGGMEEYLDQIPEILGRAIAEGILRTNLLDGEVLVGRRYLLLKYPVAFQKLAILIRDAVGHDCAAARILSGSEEGARELGHYIHRHRKLFYDPATDTWKVKAKIALGTEFEVAGAVLLDRAFLEPGLRNLRDLQRFAGQVTVCRSADGAPVKLDDFDAPPPVAVASPAPPRGPEPLSAAAIAPRGACPSAAAPIVSVAIAEALPTPPVPAPVVAPQAPPLVPTAPSVPSLRKFIGAEVLLDDLRAGILEGWIPTNIWNGQCYVLEDVTYLASPRSFQKLVEKGLYSKDPKRELNAYLDALAKLPCVRKNGAGRLLTQVAIRPGARPLWVVTFLTRGLFRSEAELARVGFWNESPIRELTEDEARALARPAPPEVLGPTAAPEVAHA